MHEHRRFEWDARKAEANLQKHRVSFQQATAVFLDPRHALADTIRIEDGERRSKAVGMVDDRLLTVVFVMRSGVCRLISARRSNVAEERTYESNRRV